MFGKNKKVLVVDDDKDILDIIEKKLKKDHFMVDVSMSGQDAIKQAAEMNPDIILLDIVLPDMDGSEVVKGLKDNSATSEIPIIFLSGIVTNDSEGTQTSEVNVAGEIFPAIGKPFSYSKLVEEIEALLAEK